MAIAKKALRTLNQVTLTNDENVGTVRQRYVGNLCHMPLAAAVYIFVVAAVANGAPWSPAEEGLASVYGEQFNAKSTASGERYNSGILTAAHRTLPPGTEVRVTNLDNGKSVRVRINDRGPQVQGRIIDLSSSAAAALGLSTGVARVRLEILNRPVQTGGNRQH